MLKKDLRKTFKALRKALPPSQLIYDSWAIHVQLLQVIDWGSYKNLHIYLPMLERHELNTYPLIYSLWREYPRLRISIPSVNIEKGIIENLYFAPQTMLEIASFGQHEPISALPAPNAEVDIAIIPLLAYCRQGYRVGYGKGHYDRFLPTCSPNILKIGISQFAPVEKITDIDEFDIKLDRIFTPKMV